MYYLKSYGILSYSFFPELQLRIDKFLPTSLRSVASVATAVIVLIATIFVIAFSLWQNQYTVDPHHAGLMLSNAKDLAEGKVPYQEIFIQYGMLTTVIQALAFMMLGQNLLAIIFITALAYALGLIGVFFVGLEISASKRLALYAYLSCVLIHELVIYPWSNYVAFPFIAFGALFVLRSSKGRFNSALAGFLFGLAILCRENLLIPIFLAGFVISIIKIWKGEAAFKGLNIKTFWISLLFPLIIFLLTISLLGAYQFWYINAIELPRLYATTMFLGEGVFPALRSLLLYFWAGVGAKDPRLIFLLLILLSSITVLVRSFLDHGDQGRKWNNFFIAFLTLLLLSSSLHLNEIFRLITGFSLGAIFVFYLANKIKVADLLFIIMVMACWHTRSWHIGNNFTPLPTTIQTAEIVKSPSVFRGQKWTSPVRFYYQSINSDMQYLKSHSCGIDYLLNDSPDAFIAAISPFKQYQIAPFGRGLDLTRSEQLDFLRTDYKLQAKILEAKDLLIIRTLKNEQEVGMYRPPNGFYVYKTYQLPSNVYFMQGHSLALIAPQACK